MSRLRSSTSIFFGDLRCPVPLQIIEFKRARTRSPRDFFRRLISTPTGGVRASPMQARTHEIGRFLTSPILVTGMRAYYRIHGVIRWAKWRASLEARLVTSLC